MENVLSKSVVWDIGVRILFQLGGGGGWGLWSENFRKSNPKSFPKNVGERGTASHRKIFFPTYKFTTINLVHIFRTQQFATIN
jgi:hypothetical protein